MSSESPAGMSTEKIKRLLSNSDLREGVSESTLRFVLGRREEEAHKAEQIRIEEAHLAQKRIEKAQKQRKEAQLAKRQIEMRHRK